MQEDTKQAIFEWLKLRVKMRCLERNKWAKDTHKYNYQGLLKPRKASRNGRYVATPTLSYSVDRNGKDASKHR